MTRPRDQEARDFLEGDVMRNYGNLLILKILVYLLYL